MEHEKVARINELARKMKTVGLTQSELQERDALRQEYLAGFRENMKQILDNTYIQRPDGSKTKIQKKS